MYDLKGKISILGQTQERGFYFSQGQKEKNETEWKDIENVIPTHLKRIELPLLFCK